MIAKSYPCWGGMSYIAWAIKRYNLGKRLYFYIDIYNMLQL